MSQGTTSTGVPNRAAPIDPSKGERQEGGPLRLGGGPQTAGEGGHLDQLAD